ncbi:MAG: isoaspartyl peptidase/L-asparaginase [candidate division Zixibacteria bacterium]|nr:isoaspartyl peptidase/L-asparaginase [candidate division Zixibacteria bacterium]
MEELRKRQADRIATEPAAAKKALETFIPQPGDGLNGLQRGFVLFEGLRNAFGVDYAQPMVSIMKPEEVERIRGAFPTQRVGFAGQARILWEYEQTLDKSRSGAAPGQSVPDAHETSGLIALTATGDMAVAVSTGGLFGKMNGRLGDSPIVGEGGYVDNAVGSACAVGVGEQMIQTVGSHMVVENMRLGMSPMEASQDALGRMIGKGHSKYVALAAMRKDGAYASAHLGRPEGSTVIQIFSGGAVQAIRREGIREIASETTVEVALLKSARFEVVVTDMTGNPVRTLSERRVAGYHLVQWDGKNEGWTRMPPAAYFCTVRIGDHTDPRQRMLLRLSADDIRRALL